jgi:small GTP-binding protein
METESVMKIAIVGLAAAGKTSLIKTLQRSYHIGDSLAPTRNVERTNFTLFGKEGNIWDFGGQEQYRNTYLSKPERFFAEIRYLFFVIDIQDSAHFPDAIDYFNAVYENAHSLSKELIVCVIFHKVDPPIAEKPEFIEHMESLTKEITRIAEGVDIKFCKSSIYDPPSVLDAFSLPILGDTEIYNAVSAIFAEFGMQKGLEYITLIVDDLLEAGSFRVKRGNEEFINATVKFYQQFATLESEASTRAYEFENYKFVIVPGKVMNYSYSLNFVHPVSAENPPNDQDVNGLKLIIDETFQRLSPSLY